jgi:hypothetical protein
MDPSFVTMLRCRSGALTAALVREMCALVQLRCCLTSAVSPAPLPVVVDGILTCTVPCVAESTVDIGVERASLLQLVWQLCRVRGARASALSVLLSAFRVGAGFCGRGDVSVCVDVCGEVWVRDPCVLEYPDCWFDLSLYPGVTVSFGSESAQESLEGVLVRAQRLLEAAARSGQLSLSQQMRLGHPLHERRLTVDFADQRRCNVAPFWSVGRGCGGSVCSTGHADAGRVCDCFIRGHG